MDRIIESYLKDFVSENGLEHLDKSQAFELFVNHTILSKIHAGPFDVEVTNVGGGMTLLSMEWQLSLTNIL